MAPASQVQEKLNLQAKLQLAFSSNADKVAGWLGDGNGGKDKQEIAEEKFQFMQLPVVQSGGGINFGASDVSASTDDDIKTIGDFINSNKKVNNLAKYKKRVPNSASNNSIYRISKDDTTAMVSLKNKLKTGRKNALRQAEAKPQKQGNSRDTTSDNSEEDEPIVQKSTTKKSAGLLFTKKKKGKR